MAAERSMGQVNTRTRSPGGSSCTTPLSPNLFTPDIGAIDLLDSVRTSPGIDLSRLNIKQEPVSVLCHETHPPPYLHPSPIQFDPSDSTPSPSSIYSPSQPPSATGDYVNMLFNSPPPCPPSASSTISSANSALFGES